MSRKAERLAGILLSQSDTDSKGISWSAAYGLEDVFGIDDASAWKTVGDAVKNAAKSANPAPYVKYDFATHTLTVRNEGCLLARVIKLKDLP